MPQIMDYSQTSTELDEWFNAEVTILAAGIIAIYLLVVLKLGPDYMKHRQAYKLTTFIAVYNVTQVLACVYMVYKILDAVSLDVLKFWKCTIFLPNTEAEYKFNRITYFTFWLKVIELSETVVFVLRKKQNQVSFLHVFHHCSTITLIYVLLKFYKGGSAMYPLFLNSHVHIVMYLYYFVAAVCSKKVVRKLLPVKKSITIIQMVQFVLILMQTAAMSMRCSVSKWLVYYYTFVVGVIFYGFYDFYKKTYKVSKKSKRT